MSAATHPARPALAVVGAGRAGTALGVAARRAGYRVTAVASRTPASAHRLAELVGGRAVPTPLAATLLADITLLCAPDGQLTPVAATMAASGACLRARGVVHCSGAFGTAAIAALRQTGAAVGAAHPLRALAPLGDGDSLAGAHVAVEADAPIAAALTRLITDLGATPFAAPRERALYHAGAVLAGSAPLALASRAVGLLEAAGVPAELAEDAVASLLEGAAANLRRVGVRAALTGPVVRNDVVTVESHLRALREDAASLRLYRRLAREILAVAGTAGRAEVAALLRSDRHGARRVRQPGRRAAVSVLDAPPVARSA